MYNLNAKCNFSNNKKLFIALQELKTEQHFYHQQLSQASSSDICIENTDKMIIYWCRIRPYIICGCHPKHLSLQSPIALRYPTLGHLLWTASAFSSSSSQAAVSSLPCQTFSGFIFFLFPFVAFLFAHLTECEKFVLGNVCLPARGHRGDPITPMEEEGRRTACGDFQVAGLGGRPRCLCLALSALAMWPCTYWHGPVMFSEARGFWQCGLMRCRKMPGSNESQQCHSKLAGNRKTLCNWDTINISKLPYNKLSVFIYFHIISAIFFVFEAECN